MATFALLIQVDILQTFLKEKPYITKNHSNCKEFRHMTKSLLMLWSYSNRTYLFYLLNVGGGAMLPMDERLCCL